MTERLKLDQLIALERASLERDEGARAATWQRLSVSLGLAGGASLPPLTGALGSSVSSSATATNAGAVASSASSAGAAGAASIGAGSAGMGAAAGAAGGVGGASLGAAGGAGAGVATGGVLAKVVAGVALVTSTSIGGAYWWSAPEAVSSGAPIAQQQTAEPKTPPARVTAVAPRPSMEPEPSAPAELPTSNEQARPSTAPKLTAVPARKTESDDFDGELMRVQKAQGALASGDNRRALNILGDRKDPSKGQFDEDRDAVRALALCRASDPQAVSFARRFLARHPNSVYVEGVRAACFAASGPAPRPSR